MPTINVQYDANQALNAMRRMNLELDAQKQRIAEITKESQKYSSQGDLLTNTVRGLTSEGQKFTAVLVAERTQFGTLTGAMNVASIAYDKVKAKTKETSTVTKDLQKGLQDLNRVAGFFATYNVFAGITNSIQFAVQEANKFQIQLSLIRTISQDNQLSFRQWSKEIRQVSDQLGEPLADVAKATYDAISNQIAKGPAVPQFILDAGDLARTTGANITDSVNLLSSAIVAYNRPVSEAKQLSALFFKTVDEGRVVVSEMANVFGRVAVQGKAVGVTIEELTGTVAFLTKQGVLTSDAFTFITNLLTQLQKPSRELQAFLESIGSPSGTLAIARFGFAGFIEKLTDEVKSGNVSATDFFKEIRAEKPFEAITNNFEDFKRITATFSDSKGILENYQRAIDIRGESPADFLNKEFNKIKNLLTENIGQDIIRVTGQVIKGLASLDGFIGGTGTLTNGVNRLVILVRDGVVAMLSFRTATAVAATASAVLTTSVTAAGTAATVTTTQFQILGLTFSRLGIGLIAAGIGILATRLAFTNDLLKTQSDAIDSLTERYKKLQETKVVVGEDPNRAFLAQSNSQVAQGLNVLAQADVIVKRRIVELRKENKIQSEEIGAVFNRYVEGLTRGIGDLNTKIKESENLIKSTTKNLANFRDTLDNNLLNTRLDFATDFQKVTLIENEIRRLSALVDTQFASGDPAQVAEAEKNFNTILQLKTQQFKTEIEIQKNQLVSGHIVVFTTKLEQFQNQLYEHRKKLVDELAAKKKIENEETQKTIDKEKIRVENINKAFDAFNKFSITEADGQLKGEFKDPVTDRVNVAKVRAEYDRLSQALILLTEKDFDTRINLEQLFAARKTGFLSELAEVERAEILKTAQKKALVSKNEVEQNLLNQRKEFEEKAKLNEKFLGEAAVQITDIKKLSESLPDFAKSFSLDFSQLGFNTVRNKIGLPELPKDFFATNKAQADKLQQSFQDQGQLNLAISEYQKSLESITKNSVNVNGILIPRSQDIANAKQQVINLTNDISKALDPAAQAAGLPSGENVFFPGTQIPIKDYRALVVGIFDDLQKNNDDLRKNFNKQETTKANFDQTIGSQLEKLREIVPELPPLVNSAVSSINGDFDSTTNSIKNATIALRELKAEMGSLVKPNIGPLTGGLGIAGQGFADGGFVGGPRGTDTVPAWLTPGEFVINREAASQFSDVLRQINSFRSSNPIYRSAGGSVSSSTTIGDINIHVDGAKSPRETAREVGKLLKRETRRNTQRS